MKLLDVAGLKVNTITKKELLASIESRIAANKRTWITTVYSEFLYSALENKQNKDMLNQADISVPDGIGIIWAHKFLSIPLSFKHYSMIFLQCLWQTFYSLLAILFNRKWIMKNFPEKIEKITGADLIWDLTKMASENNLAVYLLGGFDKTPQMVAKKLSTQHSALSTIYYSNKNPEDDSIINGINNAKPDILLVAYGPIKQEQWINENLSRITSVKLAVGLGGTFDYIAGKQIPPPLFLRKTGLEWLWRLFTQPHRIKRIFRATFGLISKLIIYKIYTTFPLRNNVVSIIVNKEGKVLVCKRNPNPPKTHKIGEPDIKKFENYWQLPQGGADQNKKAEAEARRETLEETGLQNLKHIQTLTNQHQYNFSLSWQRIFYKNYHFRGQNQHLIFFKHEGKDNEMKLDQIEFVDYKWLSIDGLLKIIHPEKKLLAEIVFNHLKEMQQKGII